MTKHYILWSLESTRYPGNRIDQMGPTTRTIPKPTLLSLENSMVDVKPILLRLRLNMEHQ
jgi:hypothetical protein